MNTWYYLLALITKSNHFQIYRTVFNKIYVEYWPVSTCTCKTCASRYFGFRASQLWRPSSKYRVRSLSAKVHGGSSIVVASDSLQVANTCTVCFLLWTFDNAVPSHLISYPIITSTSAILTKTNANTCEEACAPQNAKQQHITLSLPPLCCLGNAIFTNCFKLGDLHYPIL